MKKTKLFIMGISICIIIASIFAYINLVRGTPADTKSIIINQIELKDAEMFVEGMTTYSAVGFSGYKYTIKDENLYLQLRYTLVNKINPHGDFSFRIEDDFKDINKIFLQGSEPNDTKLIWKK